MSLNLLYRPLILTGPSGVGKTALIRDLLKDYGTKFELMISHTTRKPRENEKHAVHYYFTDHEVFRKMVLDKKFLEFNQVHTNYYGSTVEELLRINSLKKIALFDIDIQGAIDVSKFKDQFESNFLFILPPSMEELQRRLMGRKTESDEALRIRLTNAQQEIESALKSGLYQENDYIIKEDWHSYHTFLKRVKELYDLDGNKIQDK